MGGEILCRDGGEGVNSGTEVNKEREREVRTQVEREKESKVQTLIPFFERRQRRQRRQRTFLFPFVFDLSAFF